MWHRGGWLLRDGEELQEVGALFRYPWRVPAGPWLESICRYGLTEPVVQPPAVVVGAFGILVRRGGPFLPFEEREGGFACLQAQVPSLVEPRDGAEGHGVRRHVPRVLPGVCRVFDDDSGGTGEVDMLTLGGGRGGWWWPMGAAVWFSDGCERLLRALHRIFQYGVGAP